MSHACTHRPAFRFFAVCLTFLACLGAQPIAHSATPEEIGLQIARKARALDKGFGNFTARQTMTLRNKQGQESRIDPIRRDSFVAFNLNYNF